MYSKVQREGLFFINSCWEAERRACGGRRKQSHRRIHSDERLLAEEEEEEKRQAEKKAQRNGGIKLKSDEELARRLSLDIVSFKKELGRVSIITAA